MTVPRNPHRPSRLLLLGLGGAALILPSPAGRCGGTLRDYFPGSPWKDFEAQVASAGDFDGDGRPDLLVGTDSFSPSVSVIATADGSILRTFPTAAHPLQTQMTGFGSGALLSLGDLDGRGLPDVLVGAPSGMGGVPEGSQPTWARVLAGEDGAVLFDSGPMPADSGFGASAVDLGDIDGDGVPDFAIGAPGPVPWMEYPAAVFVYSGREGTLLRTLEGTLGFGGALASPGDVDGDGVGDFAVGAAWTDVEGLSGAGSVTVFSGRTFEAIRVLRGTAKWANLGSGLSPLGGIGGRSRWLAVGAPGGLGGKPWGEVLLWDASEDRLIRTLRPPDHRSFGFSVTGMGDVDGDSFPDVAVASGSEGDSDRDDGGWLVEVYSGRTGRLLWSHRGWNNEAFGQSMTALDVDGDGQRELVVGSAGETPGVAVIRLDGTPVPPPVRVRMQRDRGFWSWGGERALLEVRTTGPLPTIGIHVEGLRAGNYRALLETGAGSGEFIEFGWFDPIDPWDGIIPAYDRWEMEACCTPVPPEIRFAAPADLAGRRVEVRAFKGMYYPEPGPVFTAVLPSPESVDSRARVRLEPPGGSGGRPPAGVLRLRTRVRAGSTRLDLRCRGVAPGTEPVLLVEDAPGAGTWTEAGAVVRGRLRRDTLRGDPFPGRASDARVLAGCGVEVRDGEVVLLRGVIPSQVATLNGGVGTGGE